jgi:hypothetical protein
LWLLWILSCLDLPGICTALVGVIGRATVSVTLGGLWLGGDRLLPASLRLAILASNAVVDTSMFVEDIAFVLGLPGRSSFLFCVDVNDEAVFFEVCWDLEG